MYNSQSRLGLPTKSGGSPGIYDTRKIPKAHDYKLPPANQDSQRSPTHLQSPQVRVRVHVHVCVLYTYVYIMYTISCSTQHERTTSVVAVEVCDKGGRDCNKIY